MREGVVTLIAIALAIAVLVPNAPIGRVPSEDAGVFFYAARALLSGGTPYVDVWDHKPPLVYLIDAAGLALGGPTGVWLVQIAFLALAAVIGLRAMARPFGLMPAAFATFAWLLAAPRLFLKDGEQTSYVEFYALPLQFAALALVTRHLDLRVRAREAIAIGALGALAFLLKPTLVGMWIAIALVLLWRQRGAAAPFLAWSAIGGLAVLAVVAVFFATRGALGDLVEQAFRYNLAYSSFAPFVQRLGAIPEGVRLISPSGLAPLGLVAAVYGLARRTRDPIVAIAIVALAIEMLLATSGRAYHYYFLPWLPALAVLAAFAAGEIRVWLRGPVTALLIVIVLALMAVQPSRLVTRLAATSDDGTSRAAAALVTARTQSQDTVLVWGSRAEVLILADRRSPTRYVYQYAALATRGYSTSAAVDALLADLAARPPALIIDASGSSFVTPPLDRAGMRGWTSPEPQYAWPSEAERIAAFVDARYTRDGTVPGTGWPVWRRR